jgi:hypothetical protein
LAKKVNQIQVLCLSTEIGRGHPNYLDSVFELLKKQYPDQKLKFKTVFELSRGVSFASWKMAERFYLFGSRGGLVTTWYNWFRHKQGGVAEDSLALKILGRDLKRSMKDFQGICLVEHPLVAKILTGVCRTWYVHGEIAAPKECAIRGLEKIFVPIEETKNKLIFCGSNAHSLVVTGLLIEPGLKETAEKSFLLRKERIKSGKPLTIGFFTSGAYPAKHVKKIFAGAKSVVEQNMKIIIFAGTDKRIFKAIKNEISKWKVKLVVDERDLSASEEGWDIILVSRSFRQMETLRTVELFHFLDLFVAASHERTNWACGLGMPIFVLFPLIGTFAEQNFEFAKKQGVAYPLESLSIAKNLGNTILRLRENGELPKMAENGFGVFPINGAEKVVEEIFKNQ